jgi:oligoendopeptidase F
MTYDLRLVFPYFRGMEITKPARIFLPQDFTVTVWAELKPYYDKLTDENIHNTEELVLWLRKRSELESVVSEDLAWRYIRMTCDTTDKEIEKAYLFFVQEIEPHISPYNDKLNKKLIEADEKYKLPAEKYFVYLRAVKKEIEIFREENIPLFTEIATLAQQYAAINAKMTINYEGKEQTLQQAANYLKNPDRKIREEVYYLVANRRLQDQTSLDELFNKLLALRHKVAVNAGFQNFRDFMFAALGRFDYTPADCFKFHESVREQIVPFMNARALKRKAELHLDKLKPWDMDVDTEGKPTLKPFSDGQDLTEKGIACFSKIDSYFADCLATMKQLKHLDLDSRIGKAPGGYNYPLAEIGAPFIFMNAAGNIRDLQTLVHEGGHAVHSFLTKDMELNAFKNTPSEVAELASMSMELISMDGWDQFNFDSDELRRAFIDQLENSLETLPWVATVDKFQQWIYTNPEHTNEERTKMWVEIFDEFNMKEVDFKGQEKYKAAAWHKQLHIFEVPFYYIEYGFAQLGAIAMWKNYKLNKTKGLENYKAALKLGYSKPIGEIYKTGGIQFDFSNEYVHELKAFVETELAKLEK